MFQIIDSIQEENDTDSDRQSNIIDIDEICKKTEEMSNMGNHLPPKTSEQFFYRKIFEQFYPGLGHLVPYFWMPKYIEATDASARTLKIYNEKSNIEIASNK